MTISVNIANSALIFGVTNTVATTMTVSDSGGDSDTFTQVTGSPFCEASGNNCVTAWVVNWKATNAAEPVVVTCSGTTNFMGAMNSQYSGLGSAAIADKAATTSYTAVTALITGTTATTTTANEALVSIFAEKGNACGTFTQGTGWTSETSLSLGVPNSFFDIEDKIVSATGAYQGTATSGAACTGGGRIITLKQNSGAVCAHTLSLLGAGCA